MLFSVLHWENVEIPADNLHEWGTKVCRHRVYRFLVTKCAQISQRNWISTWNNTSSSTECTNMMPHEFHTKLPRTKHSKHPMTSTLSFDTENKFSSSIHSVVLLGFGCVITLIFSMLLTLATALIRHYPAFSFSMTAFTHTFIRTPGNHAQTNTKYNGSQLCVPSHIARIVANANDKERNVLCDAINHARMPSL